jgi:hypothetical protein
MMVRGLLGVLSSRRLLIPNTFNTFTKSPHLPKVREMALANNSIDEGWRCQLVAIGKALA